MLKILERIARFYVVKKVASKSADDVTKAAIELLTPYRKHVHTITADNALLRQYVKKGNELTTVTNRDIELTESRINYRPKKSLDVKQPAIVFKEMALATLY